MERKKKHKNIDVFVLTACRFTTNFKRAVWVYFDGLNAEMVRIYILFHFKTVAWVWEK